MAERTPDYPLDKSTRFSLQQIRSLARLQARDHISGLTVHPDTGDLTNEALYKVLRSTWIKLHTALAYVDVMDLEQAAQADRMAALAADLAETRRRVEGVQSRLDSLQGSIETLIGFFGVLVPAWANKEEVENGDDMGMERPSAASLDLTVEFQFDQLRPGFAHEEVVSITPPAGSLVKRGSTVTVVLNLHG